MIEEKGNIFDLETEVIHNNTCCYCGACVAFCPEHLEYVDGKVHVISRCEEYIGACYEFCPRTNIAPLELERKVFGENRADPVLGHYQDILLARAKDKKIQEKGQGGGAVTALLTHALKKMADAAVVAGRSKEVAWEPMPLVATSPKDILGGAGSDYLQSPGLLGLGEALREGYENIAVVGLPCHVQALRKIQFSPNFDVGAHEKVKLSIGLFCTVRRLSESFDQDKLIEKLAEHKIKLKDVKKFDISKGEFIIYPKKGNAIKISTKDLKTSMRDGCNVCYDFTAELADISAGSVGAPDGWTTLIIRSDAGKKLVNEAKKADTIQTKKMSKDGIGAITKQASRKKKKNLENICKICEPVRIMNIVVAPEEMKTLLI